MLNDIRWRIAMPYIILILLVMGLLTLFLSRATRRAQLDSLKDNLLVNANVIARDAGPQLVEDQEAGLDDLSLAWSDLLNTRVTIISADGTVLGESHEDRRQMDNHLVRPEIQEALRNGQGSSVRYSQTIKSDMLYTALALGSGADLAGFVRVALPLDQVESSVNQLQGTVFTAALIAAVAAVVIALIIADRIVRSINRLTEVARRMAAGDLDARLFLSSHDQLGELTSAFNHMADQLRDRLNDLSREQTRLKAVLENMADGVLITDVRGQVSLINMAASQLLNIPEGKAIGRSFAEVARHHELIELWQRACSQESEPAPPIEFSWQGLSLRIMVTPLTTAGQQNCLIIIQDLTRIRRSDTVRRDFISNISHELRTPLASLKALVETLRDTALDDPPAARRFLDRADEEVDSLTQMVQELLELSRIESGVVPLRLSPTPLEEIIRPPLERLQPQTERSGLQIIIDLPDNLPLVLVDAVRVQQVVSNLVHNALKFTKSGGTISIEARSDDDGKFVTTLVSDSGIGIPPEELDRIFERFYKGDRARSGGGTGLGLAIARHLVQIHGGQLWVQSKEGKGSSFFFSLPAAIGQGS